MVNVGAFGHCLVKDSEGPRRVSGRVVGVSEESIVLCGLASDLESVPNARTVPGESGSDSLGFLRVPTGAVSTQLPVGWKKPRNLPSAERCVKAWEKSEGDLVSSEAERPAMKSAPQKVPVSEEVDFSELVHLLGTGVVPEEEGSSEESEVEVDKGRSSTRGFWLPVGGPAMWLQAAKRRCEVERPAQVAKI